MNDEGYVEYLCIACGLQGAHTQQQLEEHDDLCPKCEAKLLIICRQSEQISVPV